ncbi:MAG: nucleotide exchange factor GrpE [Halobacteriaceae archaeon]
MSEEAAESDQETTTEPTEEPLFEALDTSVESVPPEDALSDEVLAAVEEADVRTIARVLEGLVSDREALTEEVDDLEERIQRVQADFQNYKKRTERRREAEQARATADLVDRLLPVRDNLARALEQDADADIRGGVEATLRELDQVLDEEGVEQIAPDVGDTVDPQRHEVVHREDDAGEAVASVFRPGYEMADTVIRPAQITVGTAKGGADDGATTSEGATDTDGDADTGAR